MPKKSDTIVLRTTDKPCPYQMVTTRTTPTAYKSFVSQFVLASREWNDYEERGYGFTQFAEEATVGAVAWIPSKGDMYWLEGELKNAGIVADVKKCNGGAWLQVKEINARLSEEYNV